LVAAGHHDQQPVLRQGPLGTGVLPDAGPPAHGARGAGPGMRGAQWAGERASRGTRARNLRGLLALLFVALTLSGCARSPGPTVSPLSSGTGATPPVNAAVNATAQPQPTARAIALRAASVLLPYHDALHTFDLRRPQTWGVLDARANPAFARALGDGVRDYIGGERVGAGRQVGPVLLDGAAGHDVPYRNSGSGERMSWDPDVYMKFANERTRPAMELLARVL